MNIVATRPNSVRGPVPRRRARSTAMPHRSPPKLNAIAMMSKCQSSPERSRRSTSLSHGAAHSPCNAHAVPIQAAESGARRQKRGSA